MTREERTDLLNVFLADPTNMAKRNALIDAHMWLIYMEQKKYRRLTFIDQEDLENEGALGLIEATKRFDNAFGVMFATYAIYWVQRYMRRYLLRVKSNKSIRPVSAIQREYQEAKNDKREIPDVVFATSLDDTGTDGGKSLMDKLSSGESSQEDGMITREISDILRKVVNEVVMDTKDPDRSSVIANERFFAEEPTTLAALGERLGVTRQRVEQKEKILLRRIRERLDENSLC